jgi:signal transduction histidine kinase
MDPNDLYLPITLAILIILFLVIGVLVIFNISRRRILKELTEKQSQELAFQQDLLKSTIITQERERARIAQELHDEIGSKLNVVNLNFNLLEQSLINGQDADISIDQIRTSLTHSIKRVRDLSHGLYPPILEKFGIQSALKSLALEFNKTGQIIIDMEIDHEWKKIELTKSLHIYRIVQELINNTIKHAKAKHIQFSSSQDKNGLMLIYKDDGIGVAGNLNKGLGMGMQNIKTRVSLLDANMELNSIKSNGFEIRILIP